MKKMGLILEYDGTAYQGWQIQKKGTTIQGIIEETILKMTGERSRVIAASRTDAGVHAIGQVAVFRTESRLDTETMKKALNALLPLDIRVLNISEVDDLFNPRDAAIKKSYFYIITNQTKSSVFLHRYSWLVRQSINLSSMKKAAEVLIGTHDFSSFMGTGSSIRNPVREILSLSIDRLEKIDFMTASLSGEFVKIRIEADGFLRHMVRNIAGTLVEIGSGRISTDRIKEILESRDRRLAGQTAPARGLFLEKISY